MTIYGVAILASDEFPKHVVVSKHLDLTEARKTADQCSLAGVSGGYKFGVFTVGFGQQTIPPDELPANLREAK